MVLGLQGYYTLQKYGSSEAIGVLVALSFGGVVLLAVGILVYLFNNSLKKVS